jgi:hypothetical protein
MKTSEQSLTEAAQTSRIAGLEVLRDTLARSIEGCDSLRDMASLSGRLQSVLAEIDELRPPDKKGDAIDEIASRRASRGSVAGKSAPRAKRTTG